MVVVHVRGIPQAQGSVRAFVAGGRAHVATEGNRTNSPLGAWRAAIASEARAVFRDTPPATGPIELDVTLGWPRPRAHYRSADPTRGLRADAPTVKSSKPDIDKAIRAVLDALTGIAYLDDAQVAELRISKHWSDEPGATIAISSIASKPAPKSNPKIAVGQLPAWPAL